MKKEGWEIKNVYDICYHKSSSIIQNKLVNSEGEYPLYGANSLVKKIDFYHQDSKYIGIVKDGSGVGRVNIFPEYSSLLGTMQYIFPKEGYLLDYVAYALKSIDLSSYATGIAIPHIYFKDYGKAKIKIYESIPIQEQIVKELDTLNDIIAKKKEQLSELDTLAQATFYDMFGDPVDNEKGWEVKGLEEFYKDGKKAVKCGPFGSALKKDEYTSSGIPVWNMDNINSIGKFDNNVNLWISPTKYKELESYNVVNDDIIISRAGTVGKMCVVLSPYPTSIISTNLIRLRLNSGLLPIFFVKAMSIWGNKICRLKVGEDGAFTHMNTGVLNSIKMPIPPLSLQNQFAERIEAIEKQKELINKSIKEAQQLFDYTMDKYFN